jgi:hypothetical protein
MRPRRDTLGWDGPLACPNPESSRLDQILLGYPRFCRANAICPYCSPEGLYRLGYGGFGMDASGGKQGNCRHGLAHQQF